MNPSLSMAAWVPSEIPPPKPSRKAVGNRNSRSFAGGRLGQFTEWSLQLEVAHKERQRDLIALRTHARDLASNNAYAHRYHQMVSTHIVGAQGVALEMGLSNRKKAPRTELNEAIEDGWSEWGECVTADGRLGWVEFQQLIAETVSIDGEVLIHLVRGYPNAHGLALEIIDADRLDWTWNEPVDNQGNRTIMGIRQNRWGKPIGYYIWSAHPYDWEASPKRVLIPANQILHIYREDRARGVRGIPWTTSVMVQTDMLGQLLNAELGTAIADSKRLGVVRSPMGGEELMEGDDPNSVGVGPDPHGCAAELQAEGVSFMAVDPGLEFELTAPNHPNPNMDGFAKLLLKGICAGLSVAYCSLSGDAKEANYTSSQVSLTDERDHFEKLQVWFISNVCAPIFKAWLETSLITGALNIQLDPKTIVRAAHWWPRTWEWIDPEKEIKASILAIRSGLSTYQEELGKRGRNWRRVFVQRDIEEIAQKDLGLHLELDMGKGGAGIPADPMDPAQDGGGDVSSDEPKDESTQEPVK